MRRGSSDGESTANFESPTTRSLRNSNNDPPRTSSFTTRIVYTARKSTSRKQNVPNSRPVGATRRKKTSYHQRQVKQLREIAKLQKSTDFMMPKKAFCRLVREINMSLNPDITRYTETALEALQEATEMFLTQILSDAYLLTLHRNRVTLHPSDLVILRKLKLIC